MAPRFSCWSASTAQKVSIAVYESTSHSFIVRIWLEEPAARGRRPVWRGQITHVGDGERCVVQRLAEIVAFIAGYLNQMGVREGLIWRLIFWTRRRGA